VTWERVGLPTVAVIAVEPQVIRRQTPLWGPGPLHPPLRFGGAPAMTCFPHAHTGTSAMREFS
jgi:hypothetical protein